MPLVFIFFSGTFFLFLDAFESLSHYPNAGSSHWFSEGVQRTIYKVFREEFMI